MAPRKILKSQEVDEKMKTFTNRQNKRKVKCPIKDCGRVSEYIKRF